MTKRNRPRARRIIASLTALRRDVDAIGVTDAAAAIDRAIAALTREVAEPASAILKSARWGHLSSQPQQIDLEDAIAASADPETGRRTEAATRSDLDAPAVPPADVSAHDGRPSRHAARQQRGARGHKPETVSP